jgi:hypothetical protein
MEHSISNQVFDTGNASIMSYNSVQQMPDQKPEKSLIKTKDGAKVDSSIISWHGQKVDVV